MNSFMKIAAMFVLSSPLALAGCMVEPEENDLSAPGVQAQGASGALHKQGELEPVNPCLVIPQNPPTYSAPVTPAPLYPAPRFEAPTHEVPVYRAPAYKAPTYQNPGEVPGYEAPSYEAPTYPGPTFKAPIYEAPIYDAPVFPSPIFEQPTYELCKFLPERYLTPCEMQLPVQIQDQGQIDLVPGQQSNP